MEVWQDRSSGLIAHPNPSIKQAFVGRTASVQVSFLEHPHFGKIKHLWVRRHDKQPMGWAELQRIKNELFGPEFLAIEVYPRQSKLIDAANMYHLWLFENFEFGIDENSFSF